MCVSGCSRVPRFLEGLPRPQNIGSVIVPDNSNRVVLRAVYFMFCGVLSRKLISRVRFFVFGSKKTKRRLRFSFFIRLLRTMPRIRAGRADLAFGSLPLTHD